MFSYKCDKGINNNKMHIANISAVFILKSSANTLPFFKVPLKITSLRNTDCQGKPCVYLHHSALKIH